MNNTIKIIFSLLAAASLCACHDGWVDLRPFTEQIYPEKIMVDPDGGETYVNISMFYTWSMHSDEFSIYPNSGIAGTSTEVCIKAPQNLEIVSDISNTMRMDNIKKYGISEHFTCIQEHAYHANFTNAGGSKTFKISIGTILDPSNLPSWVTIRETSNKEIVITAEKNTTGQARSCSVRLDKYQYWEKDFCIYQGSDDIDIEEESTKNKYFFSFRSRDKGTKDGIKELTINSTSAWTAEATDSGIELSTTSGNAGKTTLQITYDGYGSHPYVYFKVGGHIIKRIALGYN